VATPAVPTTGAAAEAWHAELSAARDSHSIEAVLVRLKAEHAAGRIALTKKDVVTVCSTKREREMELWSPAVASALRALLLDLN
jgi:hypothetical protein